MVLCNMYHYCSGLWIGEVADIERLVIMKQGA